jgi:hypothetical protein
MFSGPMFERSNAHFKKITPSRDDSGAHYSIWEIKGGMDALRQMFPDGKANEMNFVLFSTSGVHGSYTTLEAIEAGLKKEISEDDDDYVGTDITVLIVQPRLVCMRYGTFDVTLDDIEWLKGLRQSSMEAVAKIGMP